MADIRVLTFDGTDRKADELRFSLLRAGFVQGGNRQERKGMEVTRREGSVLGLFDAVSVLEDRDDLAFSDRQSRALVGIGVVVDILSVYTLLPGAQTITLDGAQFDMLKKYFDATSWKTEIAAKATAVYDWLCGIEATRL